MRSTPPSVLSKNGQYRELGGRSTSPVRPASVAAVVFDPHATNTIVITRIVACSKNAVALPFACFALRLITATLLSRVVRELAQYADIESSEIFWYGYQFRELFSGDLTNFDRVGSVSMR
jgi:hypothetical protein